MSVIETKQKALEDAFAQMDLKKAEIEKAEGDEQLDTATKAFDDARDAVEKARQELDTAMEQAEKEAAARSSLDRAKELGRTRVPGSMSGKARDKYVESREKEELFRKYLKLGHRGLSGEESKALVPGENSTFSNSDAAQGAVIPPSMAIRMLGRKWARGVGYSDEEILGYCGKATMLSSSDALGGFTVPEDFQNILSLPREQANLMNQCTIVPAPTGELTFPRALQSDANEYGGMVASWINEGDTKPNSDTQFEQVKIAAHELALHTQVSIRLLNRSAIAMENWIADTARGVLVDEIEKVIISGTGTGQPLGILNTAGIRAVPRVAPGALDRVDFVKMKYALKPYHRGNAVFILDDTALAELEELEDGEGRGLFQSSMGQGPLDMLLGKPYVSHTRQPDLGTTGDVLFVDMSKYYLAMEQDIVVKRSDEYDIVKNLATIVVFAVVGGELVQPRVAASLQA